MRLKKAWLNLKLISFTSTGIHSGDTSGVIEKTIACNSGVITVTSLSTGTFTSTTSSVTGCS